MQDFNGAARKLINISEGRHMGQQKHAVPVTRNDVHMADKLDQMLKLKTILGECL